MAIEFAERIRRIPVYPVASGYDLGTDIAMLASNESCFAPLPVVAEAAQRTLTGTNRYPDPSYSELRSALASRYGVASERIALGHGSCDILLAAGEALLEPGAEVVYAWPAFRTHRWNCCAATPTWCCCGPSRRSTGSPDCGSVMRCAARKTSGSPSTRSASRST